MVTIKESFQNKETSVCLLLENLKSYIRAILMKKRLQMIKLFGRPSNRFYPMKLCQERE